MPGKYKGSATKTYRNSPAVPVDLGENKSYPGTVKEVKNGKICYYPTTVGPIEGDKAEGASYRK